MSALRRFVITRPSVFSSQAMTRLSSCSLLSATHTTTAVQMQQQQWTANAKMQLNHTSVAARSFTTSQVTFSHHGASSSSSSASGTTVVQGSLHGRVALVTGSTSGIGLGIARIFAQNGADLVLNGFGDTAEIEQLVQTLKQQYGVRVIYSPADMSKPDQIRHMIKEARSQLGSVDILVNNAGIQHVAPVESFPADKWDAIISINLSAAFHAMQAVLPHMQKKGWGRIINIASAHGKVASAGKSAYVASKHGIVGLTKVVALENANKGITANAICPGWVLTPLVQKQIDDRAKAKGISAQEEKDALLGEKQPMLEFSSPESLGGLAAFLAGPYSSTITGTTISMDGGWTAQ